MDGNILSKYEIWNTFCRVIRHSMNTHWICSWGSGMKTSVNIVRRKENDEKSKLLSAEDFEYF